MNIVSNVAFNEAQLSRLSAIAPHLDVVCAATGAPDSVAPLLDPETEILYSFRAPRNIPDLAPNLRWIQLMGAGTDHLVDHPLANMAAIITNVSGITATPIAEHVLALMLAFSRRLPLAFRDQLEGAWGTQNDYSLHVREIRRRTVGIVGYGSIGREVARLAKAFGATILAMKRDPSDPTDRGYVVEGTGDAEGALPDRFYGPGQLHEMLAHCEYVILAMPLTKETRNMFGAGEFEAMKPGAYIVNIARGAVIDQPALIDALKSGRIGGAALDVTSPEPLPPESELWGLENVIITPHVAGASRPYLHRAFEVLAENLTRYVNNEPLLNVVDLSLGY